MATADAAPQLTWSNTPLIEPNTFVKEQDQYYFQSEMEKQVVREVFFRFRWTQDMRNRAYEYFDGRTIIEYVEDSVKRFVTNIFEREGLEDWQARIHDQLTRTKVLAVLAKVVNVLPKATFQARGDDDVRKASLLEDLYEYSEDIDGYEEFMTNFLLEAIVKGTAIGYEGMEMHERKLRDVTGIGDKISIKEETEKEVKLFAELVPLEEFYPAHVGIRTIKDMPFCMWRHEISFDEFKSRWYNSGYERAKWVKPHAPLSQWREQRPFYLDFISTTVQPGNVEIIRSYDKINDTYVILANGVWLNPIGNNLSSDKPEEREEFVSPLPFNHKELPFFDVKYDFIGNWFYGKSLPDRLQSAQDILDALTNMLLDQSFLTIFPPLLTTGNDAIEDDYLRPGRRTPIDTQGLPVAQAYSKLDLGTPSGWHEFILNYTRQIIEESSTDQLQQGVAGVGGRTTATEIHTAASGAESMLGLFGQEINFGLRRKAMLRAKNILQFWTDPSSPRLTGVLGDTGDEDLKKAFNLFRIDNTTLSHGKRGTRILALYKGKEDMPDQQTLQVKGAVKTALNNKNTEYMAINAQYLKNIDFDVKIAMDQSKESSKDIQKALQLEKVKVYLQEFPQGTFDIQELAAETAEIMGDDPDKVMQKQQDQQQQQPQSLNTPLAPGQQQPGPMNPMSGGSGPGMGIGPNMAKPTGRGISGGRQALTQQAK